MQKRFSKIDLSTLPELIRIDQLAAALGVNKCTIWRWTRDHLAPKRVVVGGLVLFRKADIVEWLASHCHQGL